MSAEDEGITGMLSTYAKKRTVLVNLSLLALTISGAVLFLILYLLFWIIDMDLLGDPEPVWAQAMWFAPQLGLVVALFQTMVYPMAKNPLRSPAVLGIVLGLVALVFDVVVSIFYFRLFWKCVTNIGTFEPLEDDICENHKAELYTIAWFNFAFFFHALLSIVFCAWAYSRDLSRLQGLREKFDSFQRASKTAMGKVVSATKGAVKFNVEDGGFKIRNQDDKNMLRVMSSMFPIFGNKWDMSGDIATRTDARSLTSVPTRRKNVYRSYDGHV